MADKTLTLGTLFSADAKDLLAVLKRVKTQINMIATAAKQLQTSMGAMNNAVKTGASGMSGYALATKSTVASIKGAVGESSKFKQALSQLNSVAAKTKTGFDAAHSTLMKVEKAIHATGQRMTAAGKNGQGFVNTANRMALVNQTLTGKLKATSAGFQQVGTQTVKASTATKKATEQYAGFTKQISRVHGGLERVKAAFKVTASYGIAATAIYAVVTAFKTGVQAMIDYDQGLKNLQAITGATDAEVMAMGETIKTVARDTKFSTSEVAEGMTLLGQAGFDAGESMAAMHDTAMLATGTLSDMKLTTDLVTTTVRAFGLQATDSGRVVDVMANAINKSKLTIDKLRIAFNYIGATAAQAGLSIEQVAATAMNFANSGLRASTIGTGFRQVLSKLLKPSERLSNALAAVGLNLDDVNPKMVGWQGSLNALTNILYDSETKTVDMAKAFSLFGLRGAQAAAVIVSSFVSGKYQDALNKVYELGTAEEMAAKQAEGLGIKIKNLVDRAKNVAVAFGEAGAANALKLFIDGLRGVVVGIETFAGAIAGQAIIQLAALTGALKVAQIAAAFLYSTLMKFTAIQAVVMTFRGLATTLSGKTGLVGGLATAGLYLKGFLAALGPLKIILLAITGAFLAYRNAMQASVKEVELNAVKYMQLVNSLKAFGGALETTGQRAIRFKDDTFQGNATNQAYLATLQRLIKAHPELADKIQLTIDAYKENNRVLKEFASEAHLSKVEALVQLHREYGEAAEDAKLWAGVWEEVKLQLSAVWDGIKWVGNEIDRLNDKVGDLKSSFAGWLADVAEAHIPVVGKMLSKMFRILEEGWRKSSKAVAKYFKSFGEGTTEVEKFSKKQKEVIDSIANGYLTLKEKTKLSYFEILHELQAMTVEGKKLSHELVFAILEAITKGQEAISTWVKTHGEAVQSMTETWLTYYRKQDLMGQFDLQKKKASLESSAKKLKEFLQGKLGDEEDAQKKINTVMTKWWNMQLREYIAMLDKKDAKSQSSEQKLMDMIDNGLAKQQSVYVKIEHDRQKMLKVYAWTEAQKDKINQFYNNKRDAANAKEEKKAEERHAKYLKETGRAAEINLADLDREFKEREDLEEDLTDKIKQMTLSTKDYKLGALDEEIDKIKENYTITQELLELLNEYRTASIKKIQEGATKWVEITKKTRRLIQTEFGDLFGSILQGEVKSFGDFLLDYWKAMANSLGDILAEALVNSVFGKQKDKGISFGDIFEGIMGMFGGGGGGVGVESGGFDPGGYYGQWHKGGIVGVSPAPVRAVDPMAFINAKRYHSGLASDEIPAILQKGEQVIPKGQAQQSQPAQQSQAPQQTYNINIQAVDAKSFTELARRNPQAIIGPFKDAWKAGSDVRDLIRSTI